MRTGSTKRTAQKGAQMTLDWLAKIIGEAYTEEMDAQAAQEIGKRTVSREDFNKTKRDADTYSKES